MTCLTVPDFIQRQMINVTPATNRTRMPASTIATNFASGGLAVCVLWNRNRVWLTELDRTNRRDVVRNTRASYRRYLVCCLIVPVIQLRPTQ